MADDVDYAAKSQSTPWFTQGEGTPGQGLDITSQRSALTQQVTGIAADLGGQSDDITAGLTAILAAINAKPSA